MWVGWPAQRVLLLFLGVVFLALSIQVTLFHLRQNFRHWAMWLPVIGAPLAGLLSLAMAVYKTPALMLVFVATMVVGIVEGLIGGYYHFAGVGERVDGYNLNNFMVGPPITLPLMVTAMGLLGLIIVYVV